MWLSFLYSALSLFLVVLCAVEIYKNFMGERRNISGIKLTISIVLLVLILFCAMSSGASVFELQHFQRMIANPANYEPKDIAVAAANIPDLKEAIVRVLIYGYILFIVQFIYIRLIRKYVDHKVKVNKKGKWTFK